MVIIYSTSWCPLCVSAKRLLDSKEIKYEEINIEQIGWPREKLLEVGKAMTVPQIVINGEAIGGYTELVEMYG